MSILSDRKDISDNKLILRSLTFFNELEQRYNKLQTLFNCNNKKPLTGITGVTMKHALSQVLDVVFEPNMA